MRLRSSDSRNPHKGDTPHEAPEDECKGTALSLDEKNPKEKLTSEGRPLYGKVTLLADTPLRSKLNSFITRASWSLIMIFSFLFVVVYLQQPGCALLVFILQSVMYYEIVSLQIVESSERDLPGFKFLYVYWFLVVSFAVYAYVLHEHFYYIRGPILGFDLSDQIRKLSLYAFLMYALGLILFVWSLKKHHYKYQFKQFAYCHMTLLIIVVQSSFLVSNMFHGLIWFLLPCSLVICNDIFAYIFGFFFGRTPLIQLSPKKTWEGFLGGWLSTMVIGFLMSKLLTRSYVMICERKGFSLEYWPNCEPHSIYSYTSLHELVGDRLGGVLPESLLSMNVQPFDEHVFWMTIFASFVAPFGGFFASGFKRAFKVKDFGDSIPGHGGITDRMDCQILMGMFVFVYYSARIAKRGSRDVDVEMVIRLINNLSPDQLSLVYGRLNERFM